MKAIMTTITTTTSGVHSDSDSAMGLSISISIQQVLQAKSALKQGALPTQRTLMRIVPGWETKMANCVPIIRAEIAALIKAHIRDLI